MNHLDHPEEVRDAHRSGCGKILILWNGNSNYSI